MEGGGVAVAVLMGVATFWWRGFSDAGVASFLQGKAVELRETVDAVSVVPIEAPAVLVTTLVAAVELGVALEDISSAGGKKGSASTLRADSTPNVES